MGRIGVLRNTETKNDAGELIVQVDRDLLADPANDELLSMFAIATGEQRVRFVPVDAEQTSRGTKEAHRYRRSQF